ncbi:hypothetical protein FRX31_004546 [Thalictrum thalictroides]|uniref:Uncharacterized protein n=1 Tax=Thalictrum thalictroides TaxID=46969 RepID=A0A7J6XA58_THATH|nr:hypothetical protein FRX31_004546 [Thalictrum thalictroides]
MEDELVMEHAINNGWRKKVRRPFEGQSHQKDVVTYLSPSGEEVTDMTEYFKNSPGSSTLQFEESSTISTRELNQAGVSLPRDIVKSILCCLPDKFLASPLHPCSSMDYLLDLSPDHNLQPYDISHDQVTSLTNSPWENMGVRGCVKGIILLASLKKKESTQLIIFDIETMIQTLLPSMKGGYYDILLGYDSVESDLKVCKFFNHNSHWQYDILSINEEKWGRICAVPSSVHDIHLPALVREGKAHYLVGGMFDLFYLMSLDLTRRQDCKLHLLPTQIDARWSHLDNEWIKSLVISLDDEVTLLRNMGFSIPPLDLGNSIAALMRNELKVYNLAPQNSRVSQAALTVQAPWATSLTPWKVESCFLKSKLLNLSL